MHGSFDPFIPFALDCARNHVLKQEKLGRLDSEETEDSVQSLVQYVIEQWPRYAVDRGSRQGFIVQIISSRVVSLARKTFALCRTPLREGQLPSENDWSAFEGHFDGIDHADQRLDMAEAIGCLTPDERDFVQQVARTDLSTAARHARITRGQARGRLKRIRNKLLKLGFKPPW